MKHIKLFENFENDEVSGTSLKEKAKKYYDKFNNLLKGLKFTSEEFSQIMTMGHLRPSIPPKSVVDKIKNDDNDDNADGSRLHGGRSGGEYRYLGDNEVYGSGRRISNEGKAYEGAGRPGAVRLMLTPVIIGLIIWYKLWFCGFHADVKTENDGKVYKHALIKPILVLGGGRYVSIDGKKYPLALVEYSNITW